ncbi:MAG: hypothetical protein EXS00_07745 [Phycisphaerales bacterium]|nr:hypothetical protein [Phycisphaerales bacterium]
MASTRTAGSGVTFALVVFVFVAVGAIGGFVWAYMALDEQMIAHATMEKRLLEVVNASEEGSDAVSLVKQISGGKTVVGALLQERRDAGALLVGDENATVGSIKSAFGLADGDVLKSVFSDMRRKMVEGEARVTELGAQVAIYKKAIDDQTKSLEVANSEKVRAIQEVRAAVAPTIEAATRLQHELEDLKTRFTQNLEAIAAQAQQREASLQAEIDGLNEHVAVLATRAKELQSAVDAYRVKPEDASQLVDGHIVTVDQTENQVYISLGKGDRIRPTMTFEVYDDAINIQTDPKSGRERDGKASIEVIRVGENSSLARIVRRGTGTTIGKNDVIANAVYSPDHKYRFLVHGKFDADADGRLSELDADYIRGRILDWGGIVVPEVDGETKLTGDLDFLVVGVQPPAPTPLPLEATDAQFDAYQRARSSRELYDSLVEQAREAQIPVLNWNRFQVLTGDPLR